MGECVYTRATYVIRARQAGLGGAGRNLTSKEQFIKTLCRFKPDTRVETGVGYPGFREYVMLVWVLYYTRDGLIPRGTRSIHFIYVRWKSNSELT